MAKSEGIDLSAIQGTGPGGRIIERDVLAAIQARGDKPTPAPAPAAPPAAKPAPAPTAAPAPAPAELVAGEQPLSKMRQVIARRLVESKTTIPHFYLTMEIFMGEAMKLREQLNAVVTNDAEKLSVNDLIVAAAGRTLRKYPYVNGYFKGDRLELHDTINVGIAVSVDDGLLTPVLHDVDNKSLKQIAVEAKEAAARARANKLKQDDLGPGTFTVSNLGMYGIKEFAAIINPPESSILAVGAVQKVPIVLDDEIKIAQVMNVTLSCDHSIVDGALGAKFLQDLKKLLENPVNLLLQ
jgi:pyruvate dehydrogenase E2 component (dihydrolipoamide acetyltransferase)